MSVDEAHSLHGRLCDNWHNSFHMLSVAGIMWQLEWDLYHVEDRHLVHVHGEGWLGLLLIVPVDHVEVELGIIVEYRRPELPRVRNFIILTPCSPVMVVEKCICIGIGSKCIG